MDEIGRRESSSVALDRVATVFGAKVAGEDKGVSEYGKAASSSEKAQSISWMMPSKARAVMNGRSEGRGQTEE